jgi:hypothetical protein
MTAGKWAVISAAVFVPLVCLVAWRVKRPHGPEVSLHVAVVSDRSLSTFAPCQSAGGLVKRVLALPGVNRHSTLLVLVTGDGATLGEPVEIARVVGFKSSRAMESPAESERRERELVEKTVAACAALPRTSITPDFLAARRAVEQLRVLGCKPGNGCRLFFQTDGDETVEVGFRRALAGSRAPVELPAPIDNTGIAVTICGLTQTTGQSDVGRAHRIRRNHSARSADRVMEVLRRFFTVPALVTFEPVCPGAGNLGAGTVAVSGETKGQR